jgi:hypothetical protein
VESSFVVIVYRVRERGVRECGVGEMVRRRLYASESIGGITT